MSKFAGLLPDIDVGQDVFETEDTPAAIGKDAYDSDDSLHRLTLRHLQSTAARTAAAASSGLGGRGGRGGNNEKGADGSIDEGGLPRKGEVERMFRRGRKKDGGREESTYTFRPRLPRLDPSHTSDDPSSSSSTSQSQSSSDNLDPNTMTSTTRTKRKTKTKRDGKDPIITREVAIARMRRLKMEMAELERGLKRGAELEAQTDHPPGEGAQSVPETEQTPQLPDKDLARPPPKPRAKQALPSSSELMEQLSGVRTSLERFEDGMGGVRDGTSGVGVGGGRWRGGGEEGLLKRLEELGQKSVNLTGDEDKTGPSFEAGISPIPTESLPTPANDIANLDARLATLELAIGAGTTSADSITGGPTSILTSTRPILPTLDRLENLINLLSQPRQLDNVSRRIKVLVADLDRVNAVSSSGASGKRGGGQHQSSTVGQEAPEGKVILSIEDKDKIDMLFGLLPRIDPIIPIIPPLLTRLRSLSQLHSSSSAFAITLEKLEQESAAVADSDRDLTLTLERVEEGLKKQVDAVKGNWESLQARLVDIGGRVEALQK